MAGHGTNGHRLVLFDIDGTLLSAGRVARDSILKSLETSFGWRATDPQEMKAVTDPVGRGNDRAIVAAAKAAKLVICAWGNHGEHLGRAASVLEKLERERIALHVLRLNRVGHPAHPLYLPATLKPSVWKNRGQTLPERIGA